MLESNGLIKKYFNIDRDSIPHQEQKKTKKKKHLINLLKKGLLNFRIKKINNSNNYINLDYKHNK